MDNFMDKLAQRFNAQEQIRANAQAEAQEFNKVREQIRAYDGCLQEMRRLNLKNVESAEQVRTLAEQVNDLARQAITTIEETKQTAQAQDAEKEQLQEALRSALEEMKAAMAASQEQAEESRKRMEETIGESRKKLTELTTPLEEFMHRESVKVYRNVQAVLTEELKGQTGELTERLSQRQTLGKGAWTVLILTLLASFGSLGLLILQLLSQLGVLAL